MSQGSPAPLPPTVPASEESLPEFTLRAVITGVVAGALFGCANAYLGLRVGLTVSTSIPIAVLTVFAFRKLMRAREDVLLEANLSQTIGSAGSSLASGTIFTIPALFLWGLAPPLWQVAMLALMGGLLGIAAMVPLRRLLIVRSADELPYPEGTACAEVLRATTTAGGGGRWIFIGMALGAAVKLALGGFMLAGDDLAMHVPGLPKGELALEVGPALVAVGYILGFRQSVIMVSGSLISALILIPLIGGGLATPLLPETARSVQDLTAGQIWSRYVRYIGAGAVTAAGIVAVARALPTMYASLAAVVKGLRASPGELQAEGTVPRTDRDLPGGVVLAVPALVVITLAGVPGIFAGDMTFAQRLVAALGVGIFGVAFVVVSSRIVGLIGVSSNPTSGMALVTLLGTSLIFVLLGWRDASAQAAILTVGTVVCVAASKAGDISQDLKTGQLVGATPARQQLGQLISAAVACWAVAGAVLALQRAYGFGSSELPAPQATLMKTVIEGVLAGSLPWGLVGTGAALGLSAIVAGLPGLSFAIGIYLPLGSLTPIFVGGLVRRIVEGNPEVKDGGPGVLAASGMIAGEGLAGVLVAVLVLIRDFNPGTTFAALLKQWHFNQSGFAHVPGAAGAAVGVLAVAVTCALLYRSGRSTES